MNNMLSALIKGAIMSKVVLISIHPEHVANILSGEKIFEYRKIIPKQDVSHLVLYCTSPVKKIVAVADIIGSVTGSPTQVWSATFFGSGISRRFFQEYFLGKKSANAFTLGNIYKMKRPLPLSFLSGIKMPPQSFCYLDGDDFKVVLDNKVPDVSVNSSMIFVGGIHGSGKSRICREIFEPSGYQCLTASSLISGLGRKTDHNKRVDCVSGNQESLLQALENKRGNNSRLLLDGHFTLVNGKEEIEPINIEVFRAMNLNKIILVKGDPEEISKRLNERDKRIWRTSFLEDFQKEEEAHARFVAKDIGIPLRVVRT